MLRERYSAGRMRWLERQQCRYESNSPTVTLRRLTRCSTYGNIYSTALVLGSTVCIAVFVLAPRSCDKAGHSLRDDNVRGSHACAIQLLSCSCAWLSVARYKIIICGCVSQTRPLVACSEKTFVVQTQCVIARNWKEGKEECYIARAQLSAIPL